MSDQWGDGFGDDRADLLEDAGFRERRTVSDYDFRRGEMMAGLPRGRIDQHPPSTWQGSAEDWRDAEAEAVVSDIREREARRARPGQISFPFLGQNEG